METPHRVFDEDRRYAQIFGVFAFKLPPLRAHNGPAGGLPRVLSGPSLGNGTRGELRMLADVRFVSRPVLSAPQTRSASLPRHLLRCCSSAPPPPSPAPPRARPFDPACCVEKLTVFCPCAGSCLVAAVRRCKGGDGRGERGRCGCLFVTEIARTDDKMLMDEMLNNTA